MKKMILTVKEHTSEKFRHTNDTLKHVSFTLSDNNCSMTTVYFSDITIIDIIIDVVVNEVMKYSNIELRFESVKEHDCIFMGGTLIPTGLTHDDYMLECVSNMILDTLVFNVSYN